MKNNDENYTQKDMAIDIIGGFVIFALIAGVYLTLTLFVGG